MAIQPYDEYTQTDGVEFGDIWHIQRRVSGFWRDFQVRNRYMFGLDIATGTATYNVQDLISSAAIFKTGPAGSNTYVVAQAHAVYTPGNTVDNAPIRLIGHVDFEAGGNNGMCAGFLMSNNIQGSGLRSSHTSILYSGSGNMTFRITDPTTADGTIRVFVAYAIEAI